MKYLSFLFCLACSALAARGQAPGTAWLDLWKNSPPFSFKYNGKDSASFIGSWQKTEEPATPSPGGQTYHYIYTDPATKLQVTADVRTFTDFAAIDWVLHFANGGTADTPILEDIHPIASNLKSIPHYLCVNMFYGGTGNWESFRPSALVWPGSPIKLSSYAGLSSHQLLPFFNLSDLMWNGVSYDAGSNGVIAAIGWTGDWEADFNWNPATATTNVTMGMKKTHLLLHPGETIRTPRIVLLNWHGTIVDSQNLWRRLVLAYYSPKDGAGHTVTMPAAQITPGYEPIEAQLANVKSIQDKKIPFDLYGLNPGWFGVEPSPGDGMNLRGTWTPDPKYYPNGLQPLGEALKQAGLGFFLWVEPETADLGSTLFVQHPDWFLHATRGSPAAPLLNLGNPVARKEITDLISNLITENGVTWYHHDCTQWPDLAWANADTPDRVGMTEINYITGLYQFWDDLRARHPGLVIDSAAGGGARLDLESISRCVALFGTYPLDSYGDQVVIRQLAGWVPLSAGRLGPIPSDALPDSSAQLYAFRSSYGAGWVLDSEVNPKLPVDDTLRQVVEEYRQVRPFFQGDFYPLLRWSEAQDPATTASWIGWQAHRPDLKAGVALLLRREKSDFNSVQPDLHGLDPKAQYEVEIRTGLAKGPLQQMSGAELSKLPIAIPDQPGSALLFYRQL